MSKQWLLAVVSVYSVAGFAQSKPLFPVLACPAIGDEYEKMISKLDAIKTSIKKDANCTNVELKVKSLEDLVTKDREEVLAIVNGAQNQALTPEQSKTVRDYAENVTKKIAALNDLFTHSNYCFKGDKADNQLTSLAGFVGEAANMVGSLSGPWGTPIALAGNVVAGFLTGLDQILKSRAGYDFSKREQWVSYVQNLCTYHNYRDQIEHLLNPSGRIAQLQVLQSKLDWQIRVMSRDCEECRQILNGFEAHRGWGESELTRTLGAHIQAADEQNVKPYGSYMLQSLGLRDWTVAEIKRVQKESASYWADASGRHLLTQAKADIEQFLIEREAPRFVGYGAQQAVSDYSTFTSMAGVEGRQMYIALDRANRDLLGGRLANVGWTDPLSIFRALVVQPIDWEKLGRSQQRDDLQFSWTHYRDQSLDRFRTALASTQVVQSFCSFFKHAGLYSPSIRAQCVSPYFKKQVEEQSAVAQELNSANVGLGPLNGTFGSGDDSAALSPLEAITHEIENRGVGK